MSVRLRVNGADHTIPADLPPSTPLMHVLREDLGLIGVRAGCSIGECGSCTVLMDGESIRSCLTPLSEAFDTEVITPEGLVGADGTPHPVQQAFIDERAAQCAYCINGMTMTVAGAVAPGKAVSVETLLERLDEHICRCGTYDRIRRAALRAAGEPLPDPDRHGPCNVTVTTADDPNRAGIVPATLDRDRLLDSWLRLRSDGDIELRTGRVEIGQGIHPSLVRIAAANLGVSAEHIRVTPVSTDDAPDEGYTAVSRSIEDGGQAIAMAAVALRRRMLEAASGPLGASPAELMVDGDAVTLRSDRSVRLPLADVAALLPQDLKIEDEDVPDWPLLERDSDEAQASGSGTPGYDELAAKLTGRTPYVHDLRFDGMLHARAVLPPTIGAVAEGLDVTAAEELDGVERIVRHGAIHLAIADRDDTALRAVTRLTRGLRWNGGELPVGGLEESLRSEPSDRHVASAVGDVDAALEASQRTVRATYLRAYQAHGAIAPSAAVAIQDGPTLRVWSHSQGINPLRRELATLLGIDADDIVVTHTDGPGCYGFNGADDAAALAAIAARAVPGRHVRLRFSVDDEFGWEPLGPAMLADLEAGIGPDGDVLAWRHRAISGVHSIRPDGSGDRLLAAWVADEPIERPFMGAQESGARNATPPYPFPAIEAVADHVRQPLRTGALRTLGSHHNVFAAESFMDELAEAAGADPVEFRLRHLTEPRLRRVLEIAAKRVGWESHVGPSGRGRGVAAMRYKDVAAYCAVIADVRIDAEEGTLAVTRLTAVCDAGVVVDEDGLRNQLEGGLLQGLSRTLHEGITVGRNGPVERDWGSYPVLRLSETPELDVVLVRGAGSRPLGAGEATTPAVAPAVANAIDDAMGIRIRSLPFGPDVIRRRLMELDGAEAERVILPDEA